MAIIPVTQATLKKILSSKKGIPARIAILGVGNELRGDDGAGPFFIKRLKARLKKSNYQNLYFLLLDVGNKLENYLDLIISFSPDVIIFVDAIDFNDGSPPGTAKLISAEQLSIENRTFSTHTLSLRLASEYLKTELQADIFLLGIQPKNIKIENSLSEEVSKSIKELVELFTA